RRLDQRLGAGAGDRHHRAGDKHARQGEVERVSRGEGENRQRHDQRALFSRGPHGLAMLTSTVGLGAICGASWMVLRSAITGLGNVVLVCDEPNPSRHRSEAACVTLYGLSCILLNTVPERSDLSRNLW